MGQMRFFLKRDRGRYARRDMEKLASGLARYALDNGAADNAVIVYGPFDLVGSQARVVWDTDGIDIYERIKEGLLDESGKPTCHIEYAKSIADA